MASNGPILLMLGLIAGSGLGFLASGGAPSFESFPKPAQASHEIDETSAHHDHARTIEVTGPAPALNVTAHPEDGCGYNVELTVSNFRFAPENVNGVHVPGEGHAHIYVDGVKQARLYALWFHTGAIAGAKEIMVTLNSNDHATLSENGNPISTTVQLPEC